MGQKYVRKMRKRTNGSGLPACLQGFSNLRGLLERFFFSMRQKLVLHFEYRLMFRFFAVFHCICE